MNTHFESLEIIISDDGIKRLDGMNFQSDVLGSRNFKIYIVSLNKSFLYVGKTNQKIGLKMGQGFRSYKNALAGKRKAGYGGYKWIHDYKNSKKTLTLHVFDLGIDISDKNAEAIEAEIVFMVRTKFGAWPENQNEIHFYNDFLNSEDLAKKIFEIVDSKL